MYNYYTTCIDVEGNILCDLDICKKIKYLTLDLDPKVKGQILYFLANVSSPKPLDVAISKFSGA